MPKSWRESVGSTVLWGVRASISQSSEVAAQDPACMPALQKTVLRPPGVGQTHGQCVHAKVVLLPLWESMSGLASGLWADMCRRHHTPPKGWEPYQGLTTQRRSTTAGMVQFRVPPTSLPHSDPVTSVPPLSPQSCSYF